jgi:hypothetical protein
MITFSATVFGIKALRDPAINFIVTIYNKLSTIIFGGESNEQQNFPSIIQEYYEPATIPAGFEIKNTQELSLLFQIEYTDKNAGYLFYKQITIKSSQINFDTEGTVFENIAINGKPGIYYSNKGFQNIIWNDGRYGFTLSGNIDKKTIIKVAESVENKKLEKNR